MLDKKTKEELMKHSKEEIIEVYEMLYELYDELGDRVSKAIDYIQNPNHEMSVKTYQYLTELLIRGSDK